MCRLIRSTLCGVCLAMMVLSGCDTPPPANDEVDPLPQVFQDLESLKRKSASGRGTGMGGGMGSGTRDGVGGALGGAMDGTGGGEAKAGKKSATESKSADPSDAPGEKHKAGESSTIEQPDQATPPTGESDAKKKSEEASNQSEVD